MQIQIQVQKELLGLVVHALQTSGGDMSKVSAELAETIGLQLLADIVNQIEK